MARSATEPRGLTVLDLLVIVAASASIFSVRLNFPFPRGAAATSSDAPPWAFPFWRVGWALLDLDIVAALVVLARRARYGGMPRPAEWLAIALAANALVMVLPKPWDLGPLAREQDRRYPYSTAAYSPGLLALYPGNTVIHDYVKYLKWMPEYEPLCGNTIAASLVLAMSISATVARHGPALPSWLMTALAALAGVCLLWGPFELAAFVVPGLCSLPTDSPGWLKTPCDELGLAFGRIPAGLLVGVPAFASWARLQRPHRARGRWTEWVGLCTGLAFALQRSFDVLVAAALLRRMPSSFRGWDWKTAVVSFRFYDFIIAPIYGDSAYDLVPSLVINRLALALWAVAVFYISRWIVKRFAPSRPGR